jgi:hypothetical protein
VPGPVRTPSPGMCASNALHNLLEQKKVVSVADQGCLSGIPDTNFSIPGPVRTPGPGMCASNALPNLFEQKSSQCCGSRMFIRDPGYKFFHPRPCPHSRARNVHVKCSPQPARIHKITMLYVSVVDQGCLSGIPDTNFSIQGPVHTPSPEMCATNALHNLPETKKDNYVAVSVCESGMFIRDPGYKFFHPRPCPHSRARNVRVKCSPQPGRTKKK